MDHLPAGTLVVFQEPQKLRQRAELYEASLVSGRSICFTLENLLGVAKQKLDTLQLVDEIQSAKRTGHDEDEAAGAPRFGRAGEAPAPPGRRCEWFELTGAEPVDIPCTTLQRVCGDIAAHADAWKKLAAERELTVAFCETPGHRQRLQTLFDAAGVTPASGLHLALGRISGGFDLRAASLAVISDREILGLGRHVGATAPPKRTHMAGTVPVHRLLDLQLGDYVVHAAHGISRYLGLARLEKSGRTEDYLTLLFANDVKLYVPAAHIGWVSRYIGGHTELELSTLGGKVWARKKERAAKAIRDIAEDLLRIQAARRSLPGIVYPPDGEWQEPFEKAFPYEETPDQLTAIAGIKKDMEATCPMDRLLCGDVGFGKTEVALRATFKAVCSSKQVAVLAPTTLLVEQHGRTFTERFAGYPFNVEVLSRFRTHAEQKRLLERLATGRVDVVIGTHRLLQKDVFFKDLGLAIIDEEQRFGVEHKEFFKNLRKSVDVLTLTATPIPRTLHMAMIGLRDISNLATPPRNRRPIITKVARVSDDLVRRAILREISRGGQVFVVHPRVYDIADFRDYLANLVPEARFAIGHGQMDSDGLENVMAAFLRDEVDVLVSTTIVESGLDIPTANTILIHDAGRFGLAELHQLRGRVGRSDLQAYCYLLLPERTALTPEGLRRLRALEEFDELGAGFQLALKDLEIRGAGNVLGREQSGEIAEIGYDLYCKLLEATVKELRGEVREEEIEVNLQLKGAAYIPETYVEDDRAVLELYRRLDAARGDDDIEALQAEVVDRFGTLPPPVQRMFSEAKLRRMARLARVPYVGLDNEEKGRLVFKLHDWDLKAADRALRGLPETRGVRILDEQTLTFGLSLRAQHDENELHETIRNLLEPLVLLRRRLGTGRTARMVAASKA
ncbi:MAG: transcription-repair coupling factor [Planctomycetota bacterium]|nr:transcription-repair coupling factor [Planctomycetota bacterium]